MNTENNLGDQDKKTIDDTVEDNNLKENDTYQLNDLNDQNGKQMNDTIVEDTENNTLYDTEVKKISSKKKKVSIAFLALVVILSAAYWANMEGYLFPNLSLPTFVANNNSVEPVFLATDNIFAWAECPHLGGGNCDLYLIASGLEPEKLDTKIIPESITYIPASKSVLYIKGNNLYLKSPGTDKELIATNTASPGTVDGPYVPLEVSADGTCLLFVKSFKDTPGIWDLYYVNLNSEAKDNEKLESDLGYNFSYVLSSDGNTVVYTKDSELYLWVSGMEKEKLSSTAQDFWLSADGQTVIYTSENSMYVRSINSNFSEKIPNIKGDIGNVTFGDVNTIFFLGHHEYINYPESKGELYIMRENRPRKLASDVKYYHTSQNGKVVFYINTDNQLFSTDLTGSKKAKIASEVSQIKFKGSTIVYSDFENNIFTLDNKNVPKQIASDVHNWDTFCNKVLGLNGNGLLSSIDLQGNKSKICSDVVSFNVFPGEILVYYDKNCNLYIKMGEKEPQMLNWKPDQYSEVYFFDNLIYQNILGMKQLEGFWQIEDGSDIVLEFYGEDGLRFYEGGIIYDDISITFDYAGLTWVNFSFDNSTHSIYLVDKNDILFDYKLFKRISLQQFSDLKTAGIKKSLDELNQGLSIADRYDDMKLDLSVMFDEVVDGKRTPKSFYEFAQSAITKRQALLAEANELDSSAANPYILTDLIYALESSIDYCNAWIDAVDYMDYGMGYYARFSILDAADYATLIQENLTVFRENVTSEQAELNKQISDTTI